MMKKVLMLMMLCFVIGMSQAETIVQWGEPGGALDITTANINANFMGLTYSETSARNTAVGATYYPNNTGRNPVVYGAHSILDDHTVPLDTRRRLVHKTYTSGDQLFMDGKVYGQTRVQAMLVWQDGDGFQSTLPPSDFSIAIKTRGGASVGTFQWLVRKAGQYYISTETEAFDATMTDFTANRADLTWKEFTPFGTGGNAAGVATIGASASITMNDVTAVGYYFDVDQPGADTTFTFAGAGVEYFQVEGESLAVVPIVTIDPVADLVNTLNQFSVTATSVNPADPNESMTHLWTSDPAGVVFGTDTALTTTVDLPDYGTYQLTLTSTNASAAVGSGSVYVTAYETVPVVNAGLDQIINTLSMETSTATATEPGGLVMTHLWTGDAGANFVTPLNPNTVVTFDGYGVYVLTLTSTGSNGQVDSDSVTITVNDPGLASDPDPIDGATGVANTKILGWTAGLNAVNRIVWFGKDSGDMSELTPVGTTADPGTLVKGETYYWAVDENDGTNTYYGDTWSFTVASLAGSTDWTGAGTDPTDPNTNSDLWTIEGNWSNGVPGIGTGINIKATGPALIEDGIEAVATGNWARFGILSTDANTLEDSTCLNMTGGSLTLNGFGMGATAGDYHAVVNLSGGTITCGTFNFTNQLGGDSYLNISGGTFNAANFRMQSKGIGIVNLTGDGVLYATAMSVTTPAVDTPQTVNLAGGTLVMPGDKTGTLNGFIDMGVLVSYGGTGSVMVSYDGVETTAAGCPWNLTADFSGDCAVNEADLEVMATNWLYTTPSAAQWSFDMATDPVGSGDFDLVARGGIADYNMGDDTGTGTLEVIGATTLDQQYAGTTGQFDTDVHVKIKSTNEYAVDFWFPMGTSLTTGQAIVGFSTKQNSAIDSTQTVEFWIGLSRQSNGYAPIIETGFDADAYLDITVNYDYDTDTYAYAVDDGVNPVRSGAYTYTGVGTGTGGLFTIKSGIYASGDGNAAPGTALIDQLDITIHGSLPAVKPGDADRDGDVDLADFAALSQEWLLDGGI